jgi:DNA (cytosine-5)-methyltransferase 1
VDKDERNLWPAFRGAIKIGKPAIVFGEQVASSDGRIWLAGVRADLEALEYGVGSADLCAAGVGAPHPRQRLYWMAHANIALYNKRSRGGKQSLCHEGKRTAGGLGNTKGTRLQGQRGVCGAPTPGQRGGLAGLSGEVWADFETVPCKDGKIRRIESGTFPLGNGVPCRMGRLRGYGNAIVPQLAATFIQTCDEVISANEKLKHGGE